MQGTILSKILFPCKSVHVRAPQQFHTTFGTLCTTIGVHCPTSRSESARCPAHAYHNPPGRACGRNLPLPWANPELPVDQVWNELAHPPTPLKRISRGGRGIAHFRSSDRNAVRPHDGTARGHSSTASGQSPCRDDRADHRRIGWLASLGG